MNRTLEATVASVIFVMSSAVTVAAGSLEDGHAAFQRNEYVTAFRLLRPLASSGNASAQFEIGYMYAHGFGVPKNVSEGLRWFGLAAEQGYPDAESSLGFAYYFGEGVLSNYRVAAKWLRRAANQGLGNAQNKLGLMYERGEGVPQDYVSAYLWFDLAAAQGFPAVAPNRERVAGRMTESQIAEAQKLSREWKPTRP